MIAFRPLIVLVFVSFSSLVFGQDDGELKAVIVLFRHGDRSPLSSWPNDIYFGDSSLWPDGYGQLNNLGKERHYRLGQWFRSRYDGFLPARYNRSDIYVRSTDVDRTLMSAASNLAGLYPPSGDQVWNENIPWQAIPIHTIPELQDPVLPAEIPCPKYDRLRQQVLNSAEFQQLNQEYAELFRNISEVTGYPADAVDFGTFSGLFQGITIYRGFNLTLPNWTDYYWPEIKSLAAFYFRIGTYTQDMARLRTGPFFDYLLNHLNSLQNQTKLTEAHKAIEDTAPPKFVMLSAHDTTVADRTNAMGVFPDAVPEFASTIIWEVKSPKGNVGDLYLNLYFKNSTHFSPLTLPGCGFNCDIDQYAKILAPITSTAEQWSEECYEE